MYILRLPQGYRSSSRQPSRRFMPLCRWINALMRDAIFGTRRGVLFIPVPRQVPSIILPLMGEYCKQIDLLLNEMSALIQNMIKRRAQRW